MAKTTKKAKTSTKATRLPPSRDTVRELYLKSGNQCAFPKCTRRLFNKAGVFVGQICHIEAAEEGGERFNPLQSDEDRRKSSNLLILCYDHHKETNDVTKFPVSRMQTIKATHEKQYSDVVEKLMRSVSDHTKTGQLKLPKTLARLHAVLDWKHDQDELNAELDELSEMAKRFATVPLPSRQLFQVMLERSSRPSDGSSRIARVPEIQDATNLSIHEMRNTLAALDRLHFVHEAYEPEFGVEVVGISNLGSGWPFWADVKKFCKRTGIPLSEIVEELNFQVFD